MSDCAGCFHPKENHKPVVMEDGTFLKTDGYISHICTGDLTCRCEHYEEPYLVEFAQDIEKQKAICRTIKRRCAYILEKIPQTRNAGDGSFPKIYLEIWHGVKIRAKVADCTIINTKLDKELPLKDSINREKRRCKQWNAELKTYDPKTIKKQMAIYEAYRELAIEA